MRNVRISLIIPRCGPNYQTNPALLPKSGPAPLQPVEKRRKSCYTKAETKGRAQSYAKREKAYPVPAGQKPEKDPGGGPAVRAGVHRVPGRGTGRRAAVPGR